MRTVSSAQTTTVLHHHEQCDIPHSRRRIIVHNQFFVFRLTTDRKRRFKISLCRDTPADATVSQVRFDKESYRYTIKFSSSPSLNVYLLLLASYIGGPTGISSRARINFGARDKWKKGTRIARQQEGRAEQPRDQVILQTNNSHATVFCFRTIRLLMPAVRVHCLLVSLFSRESTIARGPAI